MSATYRTSLSQDVAGWTVQVQTQAGLTLEYLYGTERQARFYAAVFALGPERLPVPTRIGVGEERVAVASVPRPVVKARKARAPKAAAKVAAAPRQQRAKRPRAKSAATSLLKAVQSVEPDRLFPEIAEEDFSDLELALTSVVDRAENREQLTG